MRQAGQGDRLKKAIGETFADTDGYLVAKDRIAQVAKENAAPLYEKAYSNPVEFTPTLEKILTTPAGKSALGKGIEIARNDGVEEIGEMLATHGPDGKVTFKRTPDMRVWDYIKRGFDDVIERQTDNVTGKVTTSGRAVIGLKNRLLKQLDAANPDYAAARKIAADGFRMDDALEFGRKANRATPEAVKRQVANMSEAEKQAARIGYAEYLRSMIDKAGWTHNKVRKVIGSPDQYRTLQALFPDGKELKAFRQAIFNESRKQQTFDAVRSNSTTARQLLDAQEAGQLGEAGMLAGDVVKGNLGNVLTRAAGLVTRIGGLTPDVADGIAKRLMTTEPAQVRTIMRELVNIDRAAVSKE